MNAMRPEKTETTETETVDSNLAAVTEVEAGIRDFVRNDIAYLRRPAATTTDAPPLDPSAEATRARRWPSATSRLMQAEPTCQPEAASPPNSEFLPSSSSR